MFHLGKQAKDLNGQEGTVVKVLGEVDGVKVCSEHVGRIRVLIKLVLTC